jgi:RHS repeat-associated protein
LTKVVFRNTSGGSIVKQVDYEYDPYNRFVRRTFDADGAGAGAATNQYWVYDEGINAVLQFDGSSASNLSHRYLWSDNVDELLADEQLSGSNTLWGLADHLGSLRDIADYSESTGVTTITNHRTLNSFGKLVSETNAAVDMLFAFTGKQFDEATGLQQNLFRWLDPTLGQWLNEDPIGFAAGDENVRRYVGNGVVDSIDIVDQRIPIGERCTGSWPDRVPPNPQLPELSGDIYINFELDLTGLTGVEPQVGIVLDLDNILESGAFFTSSYEVGINVGAGAGIGYHSGDIEGWGAGVDANIPIALGKLGPSVQTGTDFDGNPYGGISIGVGSGASANVSYTNTAQWIQFVDFVHNNFTIPIQEWWNHNP